MSKWSPRNTKSGRYSSWFKPGGYCIVAEEVARERVLNHVKNWSCSIFLITNAERFDQPLSGLIVNELEQFHGIVLHEREVVVEPVHVQVTQGHVDVGEDRAPVRRSTSKLS